MVKKLRVTFKTPRRTAKTPLRVLKKKVDKDTSIPDILTTIETDKNTKKTDKKNNLKNRNIKNRNNNQDMNNNNKTNTNTNNNNNNINNIVDPLENNLINSLLKENEILRNLKSEAVLYQKMLGVTINYEKDEYFFNLERESMDGDKKILSFSLKECKGGGDTALVYRMNLLCVEHCNVPEYFYDEIEFDVKEFPYFFYRVYQSIHEDRTN